MDSWVVFPIIIIFLAEKPRNLSFCTFIGSINSLDSKYQIQLAFENTLHKNTNNKNGQKYEIDWINDNEIQIVHQIRLHIHISIVQQAGQQLGDSRFIDGLLHQSPSHGHHALEGGRSSLHKFRDVHEEHGQSEDGRVQFYKNIQSLIISSTSIKTVFLTQYAVPQQLDLQVQQTRGSLQVSQLSQRSHELVVVQPDQLFAVIVPRLGAAHEIERPEDVNHRTRPNAELEVDLKGRKSNPLGTYYFREMTTSDKQLTNRNLSASLTVWSVLNIIFLTWKSPWLSTLNPWPGGFAL